MIVAVAGADCQYRQQCNDVFAGIEATTLFFRPGFSVFAVLIYIRGKPN